MGQGSVLDIGEVNQRVSPADPRECAGATSRKEGPGELGIVWPPKQVRPQGDCCEFDLS